MKNLFDTLFARVLLVQVIVALLVCALFLFFTSRQRAQTNAQMVAPQWEVALRPLLLSTPRLPHTAKVVSDVELLPGPPPADAYAFPWVPRIRALHDELLAVGLPVTEIRISGRTGNVVAWIHLDTAQGMTWVGVRVISEGLDLVERISIGVAMGVVALLLAAWWLSRRVLAPVAQLRDGMQRFAIDGREPEPVSANTPRELRELAQQFAMLALQRRELDEQRHVMLAGISHDLRSPMSRIRMAAELLPDSPEVEIRRDAIVRNVRLADRLVGSFIELARSESEPLAESVDLAALVRNVAEDLNAGAVPGDFVLGAVPSCAVWIEPANGIALERALRNLIDNARQHGAPPVELSLRQEGACAVLRVRDNGVGIPPTQYDAMLQPFARGDTSRQTPGTGLGLAIAQRSARRHGGTLHLADAAPGLCVELHLPIRRG